MRKISKWLLIFFVLIILIIFLVVLSSIRITGKPVNTGQQNIAPFYADWITYTNTTSKYTIQIPNTWDIREKKGITTVDSLVVFTPKINKKNPNPLALTSITVTSHAPANKVLTTQSEFDTWYTKDAKHYDPTARLNKLHEFVVGGEKAIIFIDSGNTGDLKANEWSLVTWMRHQNKNYYIYTKGTAKITQGDISGYAHMLSTFRFFGQ